MSRKFFLAFGLYLSLLILSGCATMSGNSSYGKESPPLDVSPNLRFSDVPVPEGFNIIQTESFTFRNDATRVALLKYLGSKNADLIVSFFNDQMPLYGWSPMNIIEYERRMLNYEKGSESCIITIGPKGSKNIIAIAISPKSRPMKVERPGGSEAKDLKDYY